MRRRLRSSILAALLLAATVTLGSREAVGQETFAWDATRFFQYNIENILVDRTNLCSTSFPTTPFPSGSYCPVVKVIFSVTNPDDSSQPWDIKHDTPFTQGGRLSRLGIDIGWSTTEYVNTWSRFTLDPAPFGTGIGAAFPIQINALTAATACGSATDCPGVPDITRRFWISSAIPPREVGVVGSGVVGIEGHPAWPISVNGTLVQAPVPVKSVVKPFPITDSIAVPRRQIVDFASKCHNCHDGEHVGIPRLALHGGNRNEEPRLCVVCHNPNQTDVPYRTLSSPPSPDPLVVAGNLAHAPEVSIDFKRLVHAIHAGEFRENPFKVVGFQGAVSDFSSVKFPVELRNCLTCHVEVNGKGTFELPLKSTVLGSTVQTGSNIGQSVDLNPANNLRITPIASVCSACHDRREVADHMRSKGASFGVKQSDPAYGTEQCVLCHGPGKDKDVRKVHEVGASDD